MSLTVLPGVTVVPAGELRPGGGGTGYQIFTPYWRVWHKRLADGPPTPRRIAIPAGLSRGGNCRRGYRKGSVTQSEPGAVSRPPASASRRGSVRWRYPDNHDLMAVDRTSRLSPYLRFGCVSPLEVAQSVSAAGPAEEFVRQRAGGTSTIRSPRRTRTHDHPSAR